MSRRTGLGLLTITSLVLTVGCKTDAMFSEHKAAPEGPVTSIENPAGVQVPDINISEAKEVDLVESVLTHRANYIRTLKLLKDYYVQHGYDTKRRWVEHELEDALRIKPYSYIVEGEIPSKPMRPTDSVAAADTLYQEARNLMNKGGGNVPVFYREELMKQALAKFKELIEKYPNSDKIDDAAFYCGEIHKEYFKDEEAIAVKWYEKSMEWDPNTPHNVHFQAAVIYDLRLHDRDRALELYQQVLASGRTSKTNQRFATHRILELTKEKEAGQKGEVASAERTVAKVPAPDEPLTPSEADAKANQAKTP